MENGGWRERGGGVVAGVVRRGRGVRDGCELGGVDSASKLIVKRVPYTAVIALKLQRSFEQPTLEGYIGLRGDQHASPLRVGSSNAKGGGATPLVRALTPPALAVADLLRL